VSGRPLRPRGRSGASQGCTLDENAILAWAGRRGGFPARGVKTGMGRDYLDTAPVIARGPPFDLHVDLGSWAGRATSLHRHFEARESVGYFFFL
jgi:hypothetical protein